MIQFSKPRRSLGKSMEQYRRFETNARDYLGPQGPQDGKSAPSTARYFRHRQRVLSQAVGPDLALLRQAHQADSTPAFTARTTHLAISLRMLNPFAHKRRTPRGYRCSPPVDLSHPANAGRMVQSEALTEVTRVLSYRRTSDMRIPQVSAAVQSVPRNVVLAALRSRSLIDSVVVGL
jgi:hypothetical protein